MSGNTQGWSKVLRGTSSLGEFFGAPLYDVSQFNLLLAIYADRPEWLRHVSQETDLPRRNMKEDFTFTFVAPSTEGERMTVVAWIVENCTGEWNINNRWVMFDLDTDAAKYKLVWG